MVAPQVPGGPLDVVEQAQRLPATDGVSGSRFDQISALRTADARAEGWRALAAEQGLDPRQVGSLDRAVAWENPYRGNGWSGDGPDYTPEWEYGDRYMLSDGAEMWVTRPDGQEELVARFDGAEWIEMSTGS